jgi:quercetin dioxygenase-like cupin family protein
MTTCTPDVPEVITKNIKHHFGAGTYIREGIIPSGYRIKKHTHTYDHFSILASGVVSVLANGVMTPYYAPACIKIEKDVEHEVLALMDSTWYCIHGTTEEIPDLESVHIG